jgi:hypothetical protein
MKEKTETQTEKLRQEKRTLRWMPRVQKEDTQKWGGEGRKIRGRADQKECDRKASYGSQLPSLALMMQNFICQLIPDTLCWMFL